MSYTNNGIDNIYSKKPQRRNLRNNGTSAEAAMWRILNKRQIEGLRFRRQYSIGPYILDFYCPDIRLCIELDGEIHYNECAAQHDAVRTRFLESHDIHVIRFENRDVFQSTQSIIEYIKQTANQLRQPTPRPANPHPAWTLPPERGSTRRGRGSPSRMASLPARTTSPQGKRAIQP